MMSFQMETVKSENTVKMTLTGRLDATSTPQFQSELEKLILEKINTLVFFVHNLSYLSSAGIRSLLFARQRFGPSVSIHFVGAQPMVISVLQQTGVSHSLIIEDVYHETTEKKGKIAVLIEEHFDGSEYFHFNNFFPKRGYEVEYVSHLWGHKELTFGSNPENDKIEYHVTVTKEIEKTDPHQYRGIILIGAYAMDRLRYQTHPQKGVSNQAPALRFLRQATKIEGLKIGTICHGLWLFCADRELLKGKKVTCAHNIICDVENAGGQVQYEKDETAALCIDGDLISARHPGVIELFMKAFVEEIEKAESTLIKMAK